jgi:hypothetical protein
MRHHLGDEAQSKPWLPWRPVSIMPLAFLGGIMREALHAAGASGQADARLGQGELRLVRRR